MILFNLDYYEETDFWGRELWLSFVEDFQDWSSNHLKKASNHVIKRLRDYLRNHGVLVSKKEEKITIVAALSRTVGWPQCRRWPVNIRASFPNSDEDEDDANADAAKETTTTSTIPQDMPSTLPHPLTVPSIPPSTVPKGELNFAETIRAYSPGKETSEHHALSAFGNLYDDNRFAHAQEPPVPTLLCTHPRLLYQCLVKLGTTNEKRLVIDITALEQSYQIREIAEVTWIDGATNPADAMTKSTACNALKSLIDTNILTIRPDGWVERPGEPPWKASFSKPPVRPPLLQHLTFGTSDFWVEQTPCCDFLLFFVFPVLEYRHIPVIPPCTANLYFGPLFWPPCCSHSFL